MKEINFFGVLKNGGDLPPLAELQRRFRGGEDHRYRLDVSPQYFHGGSTVVSAVQRALPGAHVVIALRDPVPRLRSAYGMHQFKGTIRAEETYGEFVDRCLAVHEAGVRQPGDRTYRALAVADYATHLPLWMDAFPETLRVVFFDHLVADPMSVLTQICDWLDLPSTVVSDFDFGRRNATFQHRSRWLGGVAQGLNDRVGPILERHPTLKHRVRTVYRRLNGRRGSPASPSHDDDRVRQFYKRSLAEAQRLLTPTIVGSVALPSWLRDNAAHPGLASTEGKG